MINGYDRQSTAIECFDSSIASPEWLGLLKYTIWLIITVRAYIGDRCCSHFADNGTCEQRVSCRLYHLHPHAYADDTQIYGFCNPSDADLLQERMSLCVDEVSLWMTSNRLLLNPAKTEVLWCSSARRQHQIPVGPVRIGNTSVLPVSAVRDLGIYIDADLAMSTHVTTTVRACFAALRRIRSVRRSLTRDALLTLLRALVITSVDYCCSVLTGVSGALLQRLQSVLNAAARLVFSVRRSEHTTPLLRELHWLKVPERIQFRLCVLTHRCLHGTAPPYLAEMLHQTADVASRRRLRSAATSTLVLPLTRRSTLSDCAFPVAAGIHQGYPVAHYVPPETEADPVQRLFCQLNLAFDGLLVMFRLVLYGAPATVYCDSVTLISASIIIIIWNGTTRRVGLSASAELLVDLSSGCVYSRRFVQMKPKKTEGL